MTYDARVPCANGCRELTAKSWRSSSAGAAAESRASPPRPDPSVVFLRLLRVENERHHVEIFCHSRLPLFPPLLASEGLGVVCIGCSRREPGGAGCPAKAEARRTIMSMDDDDVSRLFGDFFDSCNSPCPDVKAPPAVADGRAAVLVSAPAQQRPSPPGGRPKLKLKCKVSVLGSSALFAGSLFLRLRNERMRDPFLERKPGDGPFLTTIPRFVALIS